MGSDIESERESARADLEPAQEQAKGSRQAEASLSEKVREHLKGQIDSGFFNAWCVDLPIVPGEDEWIVQCPNHYSRDILLPKLQDALSKSIEAVTGKKVGVKLVVGTNSPNTDGKDPGTADRPAPAAAVILPPKDTSPKPKKTLSLRDMVGKPLSQSEIEQLVKKSPPEMTEAHMIALLQHVEHRSRSGRIKTSAMGYSLTLIKNGSWKAYMPAALKGAPPKIAIASDGADDQHEPSPGSKCMISPDEKRLMYQHFPEDPNEPFRSPLSVEFETIFVPNSCKEKYLQFTRNFTREGVAIQQQITVGKLDDKDTRPKGVLRISHQNAFYLLLSYWADDAFPLIKTPSNELIGEVVRNPYRLAKDLVGSAQGNDLLWVKRLLSDLKSIPIRCVTRVDGEAKDETIFTLVGDLVWKAAFMKGKILQQAGRVWMTFSPQITGQFAWARVRKLLYGPYRSLQYEYSKLGYPFLDFQLQNKDMFKIKATGLLDRFGLTFDPNTNNQGNEHRLLVGRYAQRFHRRALIRRVAQDLHGLAHSRGGFIHTWMENADDEEPMLCGLRTMKVSNLICPGCSASLSKERNQRLPKNHSREGGSVKPN